MTATRCQLCGTPVEDAAVCSLCVDGDGSGEDLRGNPALARNLGDVPALIEALVVSYTRQGRTGSRVGSRSAETAIPYDRRARRAAHALRNELTTTVRLLDMGDAPAAASSPALAGWLLARLERIRHHAAAADIVRGVRRTVAAAREAVDLPPERWYAGPCGVVIDDVACIAELYADAERSVIECPVCRWTHDVDVRRRWLLATARDRLGTATEIASAVSRFGAEEVTPARIYAWRDRGRLEERGLDLLGRPTYRVGDVLDLLELASAQASRRAASR